MLILGLSVLFAFCTVRQKLSKLPRRSNLSNDSIEINQNQLSLRNIEPKHLIEKEEAINTIHCNHHPLPDINYPSASSFCLYFNNDSSRITFINHHVDS